MKKFLYIMLTVVLAFASDSSAEQLNELEPGVVGYATQKFNKMTKQDREKFALLLQCGFTAEHLGKEEDSIKYFVQAWGFDTPIVRGETDTEQTSYFRGYVDAMYNNAPDIIRKRYTERCLPLIAK